MTNLKLCYALSAVLSLAAPSFAQTFKLASSDKKTVVEINNNNRLQYSVSSNGKVWYVGAMTNDSERTIQLKMDFLPSVKYTMSSWADVLSSPQSLTLSKKGISASSAINIHLDTAGGWVAKITPND